MTVWNDQVIIVTGGSRGIGYETARCLVGAGARVLLVARDPVATANAAATLSQNGPGEAHGLAHTLTGCPEDGEAVCRAAFQQYGRITGLVNCAGGASVGTPLGLDWRRWQEDFTVKFWGYLSLMRAVVPYLRQVGGGAIVNVAGVTGKDPNPRLAAATTINGALRGLTKILADEVAHGRFGSSMSIPGRQRLPFYCRWPRVMPAWIRFLRIKPWCACGRLHEAA